MDSFKAVISMTSHISPVISGLAGVWKYSYIAGYIILTAVSFVQVILLENCIMLLQKQDEKYLLKFHTSAAAPLGGGGGGGGGGKHWHSPVIKFATLLIRPVATGKRYSAHMHAKKSSVKKPEILHPFVGSPSSPSFARVLPI